MNRESILHYLMKEEEDIIWEERDEGFIIKNDHLSNRLLREIGACNGVVRDHSMYGWFWIIPEKEDGF